MQPRNDETTFLAELIPTAPEDSMLYLTGGGRIRDHQLLDGHGPNPRRLSLPAPGSGSARLSTPWLEFRGEVVTGTNTVTLARDYNLVPAP